MVEVVLLVPAFIVLGAFVYLIRQKPSEGSERIVEPYILDDGNFARNYNDGSTIDGRVDRWAIGGGRWQGHVVMSAPLEAWTMINPTGPPGSISSLFYSMLFQLRKWEFKVE